MIDKRKHVPLYIQLKEEIQRKIKDGVWEVDTQIPTEKALMEEYNLGRVTVREALSLLVSEGFLYKKHGIGTFVANRHPSLGFEPLISLSYSLRARGMEACNEIEDKRIISPGKELLKKLKWKKPKACFYFKRLRYVDGTPLAVEESYFSKEFEDIVAKYDLSGSIAKILVEELRISITKVEQIIIPRAPSAEEQEFLKIESDTLVLDLERWIYVEDRAEPFFYVNFVVPENLFSM
jgi:GntR family transcriptional regulator